MANEEHLAILRQGVDEWNKWRDENPDVIPDLNEANLSRANLSGVDLNRADLFEANLSGADLSGADLSGAILFKSTLRISNLSEANLVTTNFFEADLNGADLSRATLIAANLITADLSGVNLFDATLSGAILSRANLSGANLTGANLQQANLVYTNLENAILTGCDVFGISVWELQGLPKPEDQTNLNIAQPGQPAIMVDDIEVAQFIYMLLNHKKLRNVINAVTKKGVLILGRFSDGGIEVLHAIADRLRKDNYLPIIFDFDRPDQRDYTETVQTLAGLSRFVIVDVSGPSVPQELSYTVKNLAIPFVPIVESGKGTYSMLGDLHWKHDWLLQPIEFEDTESLIKMLPERVIEQAETKHAELQKRRELRFKG
ncbi:pentapeptide repeat-containing protein [Chloroflexota bacterium]